MANKKVRINTEIPDEADVKVEAFMKFAGFSKARVCSLAISAGIDVLSLATDPNWKEYFEKMMRLDNAEKK